MKKKNLFMKDKIINKSNRIISLIELKIDSRLKNKNYRKIKLIVKI